MSKESADLANVRLALYSIELSSHYKMDHAYTVDEYAENALMRDNAKSAINYINDMEKELSELREKAEAFDFLSGLDQLHFSYFLLGDGDPSIGGDEYYNLVIPDEDIAIRGNNLLDCVKQARECDK